MSQDLSKLDDYGKRERQRMLGWLIAIDEYTTEHPKSVIRDLLRNLSSAMDAISGGTML